MSRTTIALVDTKRLVAIFGPRDQHLRRIRATLGVGVSAREDAIHIEGEESAVIRATEIFEHLDRIAREQGSVDAADVAQLLSPASTAGRTSTILWTCSARSAETAIATARNVFPLPAGPEQTTTSWSRIAST